MLLSHPAFAASHQPRHGTAGRLTPPRVAIGTPEHDELPDHGQAIADAAVKEAVEKGVSYFDCAPVRSLHPTPPHHLRRDSPADGALSD